MSATETTQPQETPTGTDGPFCFAEGAAEGNALRVKAAGPAAIEGLAPGSDSLVGEGMEPKASSVMERGKALVVLP